MLDLLGKNKLNVNLESTCLDRCHRIGKNGNKGRHLIVKFINYDDRHTILTNRKLLKGKKIYITEDLTNNRLALLKQAQSKFNKENVWTADGSIWISYNNQRIRVANEDDLQI